MGKTNKKLMSEYTEVKRLNGEIEDLNEQVNEFKKLLSERSQDVLDLGRIYKARVVEVERLGKDLADSKIHLSNANDHILNLEKEIKAVRSGAKGLEEWFKNHEETIDALKKELAASAERERLARDSVESLTRRNWDLINELKKRDAAERLLPPAEMLSPYTEKCERVNHLEGLLRGDLAEMEEQRNQALCEFDYMTQRNVMLGHENKKLKEEIDQLKKTKNILDARIEVLRDERSQRADTVAELTDARDDAEYYKTQHNDRQHLLNVTRSKLEASQKAHAEIQRRALEFEKELARFKGEACGFSANANLLANIEHRDDVIENLNVEWPELYRAKVRECMQLSDELTNLRFLLKKIAVQ